MVEKIVEVDGAQLYACASGEGPPLLLVHGLGDDHTFWHPCVEALQAHHQVIRCDLRGFGRSDKPPGPYTTEQYARDLAALLDSFGVSQAHVAGISLGGVVLQRLALDDRERCRSLILVSTSSEISARASQAWRRLADRIESTGFGRGARDASRSFAPQFAETNPEIVAAAGERTAANDPRAYAAAARAVSEYAWTDDLRDLAIPALILQGLEDQLTPPGGSVRMSRALRGSRLILVPGAGHNVPIEMPVLFSTALLAFTGGVDANGL